eukprot:6171915-Pleurochrysis_carterae.AAC.4
MHGYDKFWLSWNEITEADKAASALWVQENLLLAAVVHTKLKKKRPAHRTATAHGLSPTSKSARNDATEQQ